MSRAEQQAELALGLTGVALAFASWASPVPYILAVPAVAIGALVVARTVLHRRRAR